MYPTYFHLAAFFGSLTNNTTSNVPVVTDNVLTNTSSNTFATPKPAKLVGMYSAGANITDAQLNTPSLRYVGLPFVGVLNTALVVPSPPNVAWWGQNGPTIPEVDGIQVAHTLGGAGPENESSLIWLNYGYKPIGGGPNYRLKFTGTITAVTGAWAGGAMTATSVLPQGTYDVVGMDVIGTNLLAARLVFPGSFFRPGVLCRNTLAAIPDDSMTDQRLGCFGTFKSINLPNLEILSTGANTAQTIYLDLQRTGDWTP